MVKTLPEIIAHRGSTYLAPENTLSAFRNAIDLGADGVEMDVQQTRDHGLIIHHDYLIDIGTELSAKIYDLTVGELRSIDLTKWNGVSLTTERLATLDEALACCKEMEGCTVQLELKAPILPDPDFVPHVVDCIRASGIADRLLLVSFRHDLLQQAKALMPELRIGVLTLGDLLSMMLPPPVVWQDLGLVNSMDEPLDEENCPALKKQVGMVSSVISDKLTLIAALYPQMSVRQSPRHPVRAGRPRRLCPDAGFPGGAGQLRVPHRLRQPGGGQPAPRRRLQGRVLDRQHRGCRPLSGASRPGLLCHRPPRRHPRMDRKSTG